MRLWWSLTWVMTSFHSLMSGVWRPFESCSVRTNSVFSHQTLSSLMASLMVTSPYAFSLSSLISFAFLTMMGIDSTRSLNFRASREASLGSFKIVKSLFQCSFSKDSPVQSLRRGHASLNCSIC